MNILILGKFGYGKTSYLKGKDIIKAPIPFSQFKKAIEGKKVVYIDDFDYLSRAERKLLLDKLGEIEIIATAQKRIEFPWDKIIELKPLSRIKSYSIILRETGDILPVIYEMTDGIPYYLIHYSRLVKKEGKEVLRRLRPKIHRKIDLLPIPALFTLAYFILFLKFIYFGANQEALLWAALFGYATLSLAKWIGYLGKKNV